MSNQQNQLPEVVTSMSNQQNQLPEAANQLPKADNESYKIPSPEVEPLLSNFTITNEDLRKNKYKYSQEELERNSNGLRFFTILCNQKVNGQFIAKYILNDDYYEGIEDDHKFTESFILRVQPHITKEELDYWIRNTPNAFFSY
jgi:hypothetical protein